MPDPDLVPGLAGFRYPAKRYVDGKHVGPGPWLDLIHEANRLCEEAGRPLMFTAPISTGDWWAGGWVEEYPEARVLHREDESVSIVPRTHNAAALLTDAARNLAAKQA